MSDYSDAINANSYGDLFSVFQKQSVITLTLALTKFLIPAGAAKRVQSRRCCVSSKSINM